MNSYKRMTKNEAEFLGPHEGGCPNQMTVTPFRCDCWKENSSPIEPIETNRPPNRKGTMAKKTAEKTKSKYIVTAEVTISVNTEVEADSAQEAIAIAEERTLMSLCHQCAHRTPTEEWVTSGELDGELTHLQAEDL